jgi:hypothetical protein
VGKIFRSLVLSSALLPALPSTQAASVAPPSASPSATIGVTTYHYDNNRSGWNKNEQALNAASFPSTFGVLQTVALDDQVDAQPLLVPALQIAGGTHDVLYVVTENNSLYALDAETGTVLGQRNFGAPVPPLYGCNNNAAHIGITSTPVIDPSKQVIYLMAYVNGAAPSYQLHALDLSTLADSVAPVTVAAAETLTDGTTFTFSAVNERQRAGLLLMNGIIYAGFASFCDYNASVSRGWVLGWKARTLAPLVNAMLTDTQATSKTNWFLSSVWMSGFGIAGSGQDVFFSTGNSDCNSFKQPSTCAQDSTYAGPTNIQESVAAVNPSLSELDGIFTPSNAVHLDQGDLDLSAGGVMLIPNPVSGVNLAAIAGKDGRLFLLNRDSLSTALDEKQLADGCWCGPSYFEDSDGIGRIVISAGAAVQTWQIRAAPGPKLFAEATAPVQASEQDAGFFTVVSSSGASLDSAIIWVVARPSKSAPLTLYAFAAAAQNGTFKLLYSAPAGQWPNLQGNANIVPVVANGLVYVASYKTLMIFGPGASTAAGTAQSIDSIGSIKTTDSLPAGVTRRVTGKLLAIEGKTLTLRTRTGLTVTVDDSRATESEKAAVLIVGQAYTASGSDNGSAKTLRATSVMRAKRSTGTWPTDY